MNRAKHSCFKATACFVWRVLSGVGHVLKLCIKMSALPSREVSFKGDPVGRAVVSLQALGFTSTMTMRAQYKVNFDWLDTCVSDVKNLLQL